MPECTCLTVFWEGGRGVASAMVLDAARSLAWMECLRPYLIRIQRKVQLKSPRQLDQVATAIFMSRLTFASRFFPRKH